MIAEIWYTPVGQAYSDFEVAAFVERVLAATATPGGSRAPRLTFQVSTENVIHAVRRAVAEARLDVALVRFRFRNQEIEVNRYGAIPDWPKDFACLSGETAEAIIRAAFRLRRTERSVRAPTCQKGPTP